MATLYDRIKYRREALGLSQTELAERLGYNDRSTIAKIEKGVNDLNQSKIEAFAEALETTPAYLMGWTDDPYDYDLDPDGVMADIPLDRMRYWQSQGMTNQEIYQLNQAVEEDAQREAAASQFTRDLFTDEEIRAAFFRGADPTLTEDELADMWDDVQEYIAFKTAQKKRKGDK